MATGAPAAVSLSAVPSVRPSVNKWAVAVAVAVGALLEIIDTSIVNVALTDMQAALGATLSEVSWVVSSYGIANVIVLPLAAFLGHRFGKKNYFVFSMIGFTLASVLCGVATTLPMLVIARVLQGLAGGGLMAKAQAILFETFPREEQALAQGFFGAIVIAGPAIGPTLGGYIVTTIGWRWIFFINVPVGIAGVLLSLSALPRDEQRSNTVSIDWLAIALLATGIGSLQAVLEEGNDADWFDSKLIIALACVAVVGLTTFVYRQLHSDRPVVDLRVLRHRSLWAGSILSTVIGMALYGAIFAVPVFAGTVLHYTSQQIGWLLFPGAMVAAVAMMLAARLAQRMDPRLLLCIGGFILIGALMQLARLNSQMSGDDLFFPLLIRSGGTVLMFLPLQLAAIGPIPRKDVAAATGFFNLTRQLGGSMGVAMLTVIITHRQAFHHATLAEKLTATDPATQERIARYTQALLAKGFTFNDAHNGALSLLDHIVGQQAAVMAFNDSFWVTGILVLLSLPLALLLGRPPRNARVQAGH